MKGALSMQLNKKGRVAILAGVLTMALALSGCATKAKPSGDLVITKAEITDQATFFPVTAKGIKMEVMAVKASDGTVRTALNTCQVCYGSGYGYYVQQGDQLQCQNCGNIFMVDQVELQRGGCNPVPVSEDQKQDDGDTVTISAAFLDEASVLFTNWKDQ